MGKKKNKGFVSDFVPPIYDEVYGEKFETEKIIQVNAADADLEYSRIFGANKNLYRTIASLIDGLKPGKRRLFYSWWELEHCPTNTDKNTLKKLRYYRADKLSSNTTGDYHPHSSAAIDEMTGREGQYWMNNVMTIVPHGSYGNMRGDLPAAGRYREAKMSEYMIDCFFDDFDEYCVPTKRSYDDRKNEPEYLPAKYPHILFNPQFSGIGYGLASNIPPFNVSEVLDATIELLYNPKADILLIPDSPTGCDIVDIGNFKEMNQTGQAKIVFKATADIDYVNNTIHITTLPLRSSSSGVIRKIVELRKNKKLEDISEIHDSTKEGEVDIRIFLAPDAKPEKILKELYKRNIGLREVFPVGITVIDDYQEYEYGVRETLLHWIDYRIDGVRSKMLNSYQVLSSKAHTNDVLLMVFNKDNIDTTIKIAKTSKSKKETVERLMNTFNISSLQAETIADMKVYNFNEDQYQRFKDEKIKISEKLNKVEEILEDEDKLRDYIAGQLREGKVKWGSPRKSKIVFEKDNKDIPDTEHLVGITESGFIKKISIDNPSIGMVGNTNSNISVLKINNREDILLIDSLGNVSKIPVHGIPNMEYDDVGVELSRFSSVMGEVRAIMELPSMNILKVKDENLGIVFITKKGIAKKVSLGDFKKLKTYKSGITLGEGDEVVSAMFSTNSSAKDIIISTNIGNGIRLPLSEIRTLGANAKGVSMVNLRDDEEVVSASLVNPKKKLLFYLTSSGRVKVTEMKYFPQMERRGETINLISLQGSEILIGVSAVNKSDIVMIYRKKGEPEQVQIKDLEISSRISKGEKLIKTGRSDSCIAYKIFTK